LSPTVLAAAWGVLATWWVGLPLGLLLAIAARAGSWPPRAPRELVRPLGRLLLIMGAAAGLAATLGWLAHTRGWHPLAGDWAAYLPPERHARFQAAWWAHLTSYGFAAIGGLSLVGKVAWDRRPGAQP
jgi:hypothetical protein